MSLKAGLYIVATPIGNLQDITLRAIEVLKNSSTIICEDTRISAKLLAKHNIKAKLMVYNDQSCAKQRDAILSIIREGRAVSLISDAGTPLVSDPGYKLVRFLKSENILVDIVPGCSAPIAALAVSGLATDRFLFAGFLPKTSEGKRKIFKEFCGLSATLIFFETALRLLDSLEVAYETFGDREACVARELTKLYQEIKLEKLSKLIEYYREKPARGEIVLLLSGQREEVSGAALLDVLENQLRTLFKEGYTAKAATELVFSEYGKDFSKSEIYKLANKIKL